MTEVIRSDAAPTQSHAGAARTLRVLEAVARNAPGTSSVTGLAESLELSKTVVHRLLQQLVDAGFVTHDADTRQYRLGQAALMLGMAALRSLDVPQDARPYLQALVRETGETATLSMRQGWSRVYLDQVASPREVRMTVVLGTTHPLYAGSSSKAILAFLGDEEIERYLGSTELVALTGETITDRAALLRDLAQVRDRGYAMSLGERQESAASIAAPVFVADETPWGSISLCGPLERFSSADKGRYASLVRSAARRLSEGYGHRKNDNAEGAR